MEDKKGFWLSEEEYQMLGQLGGYLSGMRAEFPKRKFLAEFDDFILGLVRRRISERREALKGLTK